MRFRFAVIKVMEKLSARNTKTEFPLLDLPNELIAYIIELVDDIPTLRRLACSSRRVQHLTEPVLWRKLLVKKGTNARQILAAYITHPSRAKMLQVLNVPCDPDFGRDLAALAALMDKAENLKTLEIQSPSCNEGSFETEAEWRPMMDQLFLPFQRAVAGPVSLSNPLQKLTKLTLHLNGSLSPYWTPDARSLAIFLHPTLKYLRLSCVNISEDIFNEVSERSITPLKHLILEESNITHEGLHGLLALPKALESLRLGENCYNERHFVNEVGASYNHMFRNSARSAVDTIKQQKHSLKSLTYGTAGTYVLNPMSFFSRMMIQREAGIDAGFADFHQLEHIALIGCSAPFERAVLSSQPPPNLRSLHFQSENPIYMPRGSIRMRDDDEASTDRYLISMLPFFRAPSASVPATLKSLRITYQHSFRLPPDMTDEKRWTIRRAAAALRNQHGVCLTVTDLSFGHYFPPFLYGEPEPKQRMLYDGARDAFLTVVDNNDDDSDGEWVP